MSSKPSNEDIVPCGGNDSEHHASCNSDCTTEFNKMSPQEIEQTIKKLWKHGLTLEEGTNVFLSICIQRFERISDLKEEYKVTQNVHTSKKKNPVYQIMTLESWFLSIMLMLMAYIVYCWIENISEKNLAVMCNKNELKRKIRKNFLDNLTYKMNEIQEFSEKSDCFIQIFNHLSKKNFKNNPHKKMEKLHNNPTVMSVLKDLREQLKKKLKSKNGLDHFSYENYFQNKHHKGILDEHYEFFHAMRLHYFILKDDNFM